MDTSNEFHKICLLFIILRWPLQAPAATSTQILSSYQHLSRRSSDIQRVVCNTPAISLRSDARQLHFAKQTLDRNNRPFSSARQTCVVRARTRQLQLHKTV